MKPSLWVPMTGVLLALCASETVAHAFGSKRKTDPLLLAFGNDCSSYSPGTQLGQSVTALTGALKGISESESAQNSASCPSKLSELQAGVRSIDQTLEELRADREISDRALKIEQLELFLATGTEQLSELRSRLGFLTEVSASRLSETEKRKNKDALDAKIAVLERSLERARGDLVTLRSDSLTQEINRDQLSNDRRLGAYKRAEQLSAALASALNECPGSMSRAFVQMVPGTLEVVSSVAGLTGHSAAGLLLGGSLATHLVSALTHPKLAENEVIDEIDRAGRPVALSCTLERFTKLYCSSSEALKRGTEVTRWSLSEDPVACRAVSGFELLEANADREIVSLIERLNTLPDYGTDSFGPAAEKVQSLHNYVRYTTQEVRRVLAARKAAADVVQKKRDSAQALSPAERQLLEDRKTLLLAEANLVVIRRRTKTLKDSFLNFQREQERILLETSNENRPALLNQSFKTFLESLRRTGYVTTPANSAGGTAAGPARFELSKDLQTVVNLQNTAVRLETAQLLRSGETSPADRLRAERVLGAVARRSTELQLLRFSEEVSEGLSRSTPGSATGHRSILEQRRLETATTTSLALLQTVGHYLTEDLEDSLEELLDRSKERDLSGSDRAAFESQHQRLCLLSLSLKTLSDDILESCRTVPLFQEHRKSLWSDRACIDFLREREKALSL